MAGRIVLKKGRERAILNRHPWVFSGAISHVQNASDGDTVEVVSSEGEFLARAGFNSRSQIAARVWTLEYEELIDAAFLRRHLERAIRLRRSLFDGSGTTGSGACRLVNAESDGLPGLIVDRYGDFVLVQFLTLGADRFKGEIVDALVELLEPRGIYERSDVDVRKKEGLASSTGVLFGQEPPEPVEIEENGLRFSVDVKAGHKTGFYLDQRENRRRAAPYLKGQILNAFAYTGGFGVYAAQRSGATVLNLDASLPSLALARENFAMNGVGADSEFLVGDVFRQLREFREQGREFDAIVLDPPKFVFSAGQLERGLRGYKDINLLAFQLIREGGSLVTFSCSGLVPPDLFQKVVFEASVDAQREGQILEKLSQSPDHPILLSFPESEYLKGLIVRVL